MTLEEIVARVRDIEDGRGDDEMAHSMEDPAALDRISKERS